MTAISLQQQLFQQVKAQVPANVSFADELAELLCISNDSAYRRIRGEKPLTLDELQTLCKKYKLSLDQIMSLDSQSIVFKGRHVDESNYLFSNYLDELCLNLQAISEAGHKVVYYEAKDIPLFYFFYYPELAAFKYFFWMKTMLSYTSLSKTQFEDNELVDTLLKPGRDIARLYNAIPSVEIWSPETVHSIIKQIMFHHASGVFRKKETAANLLQQLTELIDHIKDQAEAGEKFEPGRKPCGDSTNFKLFTNEVFIGQNTVMIDVEGKLSAFVNHNVLNYMSTSDPVFCEYTRHSLDNAMKKSVLISAVGEKDRNMFFNALQRTVNEARGRL